jgi:glycosyltransferase involved in cell wall biosynthesis
MRILHVVTLISPDGSFGGPVRVAANLAAELRSRGHEVLLAAGERGYGDGGVPAEIDGTPVHAFPVRRLLPTAAFSGMTSPGMLGWLPRAVRGADLVHVHIARDLVTLPVAAIARAARVPYVVQPHGQIVASDNRLAGPLDAIATRRLLAGAEAVLYLSPTEKAGLLEVEPELTNLQHLGNGVPAVEEIPPLPDRPEVLFLSRVDERKRPLMFAEVGRQLLAEGIDASFAVVGPDEGEGPAVEAVAAAVGDPSRLRYEGALDPSETLARMGRSSLFVLPSTYEPYPMSVLEAMSIGRAVIVTDVCGLAPAVRESGCGIVVDTSYDALLEAVRRLLQDPAELAAMGARAAEVARERFSMGAITDRLEDVYAGAVAAEPQRR